MTLCTQVQFPYAVVNPKYHMCPSFGYFQSFGSAAGKPVLPHGAFHYFPAMEERNCYPKHVRDLVRSWWVDRIRKSVDIWKEGKLVRGIMVRTITGKGLKVFFETRVTQTGGGYLRFLLNRQRSVYGQLGEYVLQGVTVSMVKERIKDDVGPVEDLRLYRGARGCPSSWRHHIHHRSGVYKSFR
jgi:hypothetical protein